MKQIYRYKKAMSCSGVGNINRTVKTEDGYLTIHHELKNGFPLLYWFSTFIAKRFRSDKDKEIYISFDIRDLWYLVDKKEPEKWLSLTDRRRLTEVAKIIKEMRIKSPENFIQQCRIWDIQNDLPFGD